jgi:hypothetical protein
MGTRELGAPEGVGNWLFFLIPLILAKKMGTKITDIDD